MSEQAAAAETTETGVEVARCSEKCGHAEWSPQGRVWVIDGGDWSVKSGYCPYCGWRLEPLGITFSRLEQASAILEALLAQLRTDHLAIAELEGHAILQLSGCEAALGLTLKYMQGEREAHCEKCAGAETCAVKSAIR